MPMGLELGKGGVYVGEGAEIVHLKNDGDNRAETGSSRLLPGDSHQNINSFVGVPEGR